MLLLSPLKPHLYVDFLTLHFPPIFLLLCHALLVCVFLYANNLKVADNLYLITFNSTRLFFWKWIFIKLFLQIIDNYFSLLIEASQFNYFGLLLLANRQNLLNLRVFNSQFLFQSMKRIHLIIDNLEGLVDQGLAAIGNATKISGKLVQ